MLDLPVLEIARTWSFWDEPVPSSVPRRLELPETLSDSVALAIQGVRRCGKSVLLQQLIGRYGLNPAHCAFLNFEDPRLSNALSYELLDLLVARFRERHADVETLYFFLDEIQSVDGWERWLRSQLERPRGNVFVITGSNASLLSGELSTVLTGRFLSVELYPFDLAERRARDPAVQLGDFLRDGGFPEPLARGTPDALLRQYFHDIVERDVRERVGARSSLPIRQVVQMVYESAGSELSLRRIAGAAGIAVETASSYLDACEAAYLLFGVPWFSYSARKRAHRNQKYYPVDTGLRRVAVTSGSIDQGRALECAVYLALRQRHESVFYWRGKQEVDFVVQDGRRVVPVQVTWGAPKERHHAALEEFYEEHPHADEALFVTSESFAEWAS